MKGLAAVSAALAALAAAAASPAFERVGLVDSLDFAKYFDCETATGTVQIIEHVLARGANAIWWRANGGGLIRWPSKEETGASLDSPFDKRRIPDDRPFYGRLRLDRCETNLIAHAFDWCRRHGVPYGIHFAYEENHGSISFTGGWNLRHPEYWVKTKEGIPWPGHASLAFPEVFERKMRMIGELLDMEPQWFYVDTFRSHEWSVRCEYVEPVCRAWREKYGSEPPAPSDLRWVEHVETWQNAYYRAIKREIEKRGGKTKLCVGISKVRAERDTNYLEFALNWKRLAAEGTIDAIAVLSVDVPKRKSGQAAWDAIRDVYRHVWRNRGRADVYFSCNMYDYHPGIPTYSRVTGDDPATCAAKLVELAKAFGARGVVMECVDYANYPDDVVAALEKRE